MDPKEIRELIELISRSNFASFELERDDFKLKLVKEQSAAPLAAVGAVPPSPATVPPAATPGPVAPASSSPAEDSGEEGLVALNSPIVGTYYAAPAPDSPPFVEVGQKIKKGQVLCIVEAMKVMNEIESEVNAEVVEILVSNGQPVEYGEVLLRLRPSN